MANKASADKKNRQAIVRRTRNRAHRSRLRTEIKKLRLAVESGDAKTALELLPSACGILDRTANKGVIHRNAAARTKSRLTRAVASLQA